MISPFKDRPIILVVYLCFPHYRSAIVEALSRSSNYKFIFSGSDTPQDSSIKLMKFDEKTVCYKTGLKFIGPFIYQPGIYNILKKHNYDAVIFLGNPYIISYWIYSILLRLKGIPVLFWTHGWINTKESPLKKIFRNIFYRLSNGLLLYGERAKKVGIDYGFSEDKMFVIYNSLDFEYMKKVYTKSDSLSISELRSKYKIPVKYNVLICSARLTDICRFDLLINAASILINEGKKIFVVLIGDGPVREELEAQAKRLSVPIRITGQCYDETLISEYHKLSDIAVSPGKVGLSAMHSLTYKTPMITHDNFDKQMPEYEAIVSGVTGDFFKEGDAVDLAIVIKKWLGLHKSGTDIGQQCINRISDYYSPSKQVREIENALTKYVP